MNPSSWGSQTVFVEDSIIVFGNIVTLQGILRPYRFKMALFWKLLGQIDF